MTRFRALVAEDEPLAREMVAALLRADPDIESVLECGDAASARDNIARLRPDIAFLDVELPGATGLQVADAPRSPRAGVVFITAFSSYATQAFDVSAVDYVLKPFSDRAVRRGGGTRQAPGPRAPTGRAGHPGGQHLRGTAP